VGASELILLAVAQDHRNQGVGGTLLEQAAEAAKAAGASSQWLVTTNDNLDALRLYQRHAYRLAALHPGAVDDARRLKPALPQLGQHGIPLHDELVLERLL
jgi:ribosomal protein S18 acetylase RimI-like enzyme